MRAGTVTARGLTEAYLERIRQYDPDLNALVTLNPDALAEADALDRRLAGAGPGAGAGADPLHGIPVVVKDQAETAGIPTAFGSRALRDYVPSRDATAVQRLRGAGAIILGKAAMPDFATSWHGHSSRSGVTRNPYDPDRDPGGSSGGTAAAVSANLALLGLGEDTGGSLRVPASFCGLVALRTTPGVISRAGFCPLVREQDTPGPLTRTVRDLATALDVLAGWDPEDPFTVTAAVVRRHGTFSDQLSPGGLAGARVGVLRERFGRLDDTEHVATSEVVDGALGRMQDAGAVLVDPVGIDGLDAHLMASFPYFLQSRREVGAFLARRDVPVTDIADLVAAGDFWPSLVLMEIIAAGPTEPEALPEYARLLDARAAFGRAVAGVMAEHRLDALAYPTAQIPAPLRADIDAGCWEQAQDGVDPPGRRPSPVNVLIASQALLPAITLPVGMIAGGLPVGLDDETVVQFMRAACWCVDDAPVWSVEATLAYMDRTGIQMQMLSNIPKDLESLRASNDFGAGLVTDHPDRFGLLAALPTDDPDAALAEIERAEEELHPDGYTVTCSYNGTDLGDEKLEPVWAELARRRAVVFAHPDAYRLGEQGRPAALLDVAFETTRTFVDMLYGGVFRRHPDVRFVVAHCGAALPALSGRLMLLGLESWVPNPEKLTPSEMRAHLRRLHLDTAATSPTTLAAALSMTTHERLVYGSDCGVSCTTDATMDCNLEALLNFPGLSGEQLTGIGRRAFALFPAAAERAQRPTAAVRA